MARPRLIAITGTPGCGKTTLASLLPDAIDLKAHAAQVDAVVDYDHADEAAVIDMDAIRIVEGHLSQFLEPDECWVLRCDPRVLEARLEARGYSPEKVRENVEAECLDIILQEALDHAKVVIQRDATHRSPEELLSSFLSSSGRTEHDLEPVDWTPYL
ncbi:MAG: adenylate kinase family protein [Thermoplasmatota archaeon]